MSETRWRPGAEPGSIGIKGVELLSCGKEELGGRERSTSCMSPWQWVQLHSLGFAMTGI